MTNPSPLEKAADILLKIKAGYYTAEQVEGGMEIVEALLRWHYADGREEDAESN